MTVKIVRMSHSVTELQGLDAGSTGRKHLVLNDSPACGMQAMVVIFGANHEYSFIRDLQPGSMSFTCLHGSLSLDITSSEKISPGNVQTYGLAPGDILYMPRIYWRRTRSHGHGAIFVESIEGIFDSEKRECFAWFP